MRSPRMLVPLALSALLAACADRDPVAPSGVSEPSAVRTFVIYGQPISLGGPDTRQPIGYATLQLQRWGGGDAGIIIIGGYDWTINWTIVAVNGGGNTPQGVDVGRLGGGGDRLLLDFGDALEGMRCESLRMSFTTRVPDAQLSLVQQLFGDPGGFEMNVSTLDGSVLMGQVVSRARPTESLSISRLDAVDASFRLGDPIPTERLAIAGLQNATASCQRNL